MVRTNDRLQKLTKIRAGLEQAKEALSASNKMVHPASMGISIAIEHIDMAIAEIDASLSDCPK